VPVGLEKGVGSLVERLASGSFVGEPKLSISNRKTLGRRDKAELRLEIPIVVSETINGVDVTKVLDTSYARISYDWSPHHTAVQRDAIMGMVSDSQGTVAQQPFINKVMVCLERLFG
jgi:hypothetical protein